MRSATSFLSDARNFRELCLKERTSPFTVCLAALGRGGPCVWDPCVSRTRHSGRAQALVPRLVLGLQLAGG